MSGLTPLAHRIDAVIDGAVYDGRIVGTVVLVTQNGERAYARAAGHADREAGSSTSIDTLFRLASLTKPMAAAALALVERGRLALDDSVTTFLPDFRPRLVDGTAPEIQVRHLLTHTAGFGYPTMLAGDRYRAADVSTGLDQPGLTLEENLERIASVPLHFVPGSAWRYGFATDVLGAILAVVVGGSLADAISEYVTGPLGMGDTAFAVRDPARLAVPYADGAPRAVRMTEPCVVQDLTFSPARAFDERSFQSGGAGMVGTAEDFMTFLETMRRGGLPILDRGTVAMASANQIGTMREQDEPGWGFGLLSGVLTNSARAPSGRRTRGLSGGAACGETRGSSTRRPVSRS